jgi:ABC-2 type transport system permease protein
MTSSQATGGTAAVLRLILRRDRIRLPIWLLGIIGVVAGSANGVQSVYATPRDRQIYADTIGNSAGSIAMGGPPNALETMGGITVFETSATALVSIALMAIFLGVRHSRGEEEAGRLELLRSAQLGRMAPLTAVGLYLSAASVIVGAGIALSFVGLGLPAIGSWVFGASVTATGLVFAAVALVAAQVTEHARAAVGGASAVLAVAFALRAIGDVSTPALSWLSPLGWSQATAPYDRDRWWPLLLSLAASGGMAVIAALLVERRDLGAGLVAPRLGPATASRRLAGAWGLTARLQRTAFGSWTVGMLLGGVGLGSVAGDVEGLVKDRPDLQDVLAPNGGDITDAYLGTALLILALVAAGYTVSSVLRMRSEETAGRLEPLLSTGLARLRWAAGAVTFAAVSTIVVLLAGGIGLGLTSAGTTNASGVVGDSVAGSLAYVPAAFLLAGLAVALVGWFPRATQVAWAFAAACFVVGYLGQVLSFPNWLRDLSPYTHVPQVPTEGFSAGTPTLLLVLALLLGAAGFVGLQRRDIG